MRHLKRVCKAYAGKGWKLPMAGAAEAIGTNVCWQSDIGAEKKGRFPCQETGLA
jgi:hypothetical protein